MGGDSPHWQGPGGVPPLVQNADTEEETTVARLWELEAPSLEEVMREVVWEDMETYISRIQKTFSQFITTRTILYLCLDSYRSLGVQEKK